MEKLLLFLWLGDEAEPPRLNPNPSLLFFLNYTTQNIHILLERDAVKKLSEKLERDLVLLSAISKYFIRFKFPVPTTQVARNRFKKKLSMSLIILRLTTRHA